MNVRQNTARTVTIGPILDADGVAKTDEVVASILASKNGGAYGALNGAATLTHSQTGFYLLALTASDIDTLGCLELSLNSGTNTMPVVKLNVMPISVWDALYSLAMGAANGLTKAGATYGDLDTLAIHGDAAWATATSVIASNMRGTDGANTTVPDAAGTAATLLSALETHGDSTWATGEGASASAIATAVWVNGTRTLTQSADTIASAVSGSSISCHRGDTLSASFTGFGSMASRSNVWFTVKERGDGADSTSRVMITEAAGLLLILGATAATLANGEIDVTDEDDGNLTVTLKPVETAKLVVGVYVYDIQMITAAGVVTTLSAGEFTVNADVTKATS